MDLTTINLETKYPHTLVQKPNRVKLGQVWQLY